MVAKQLADILGIPTAPRADRTLIVGDLGAMPDINDNLVTSCKGPIEVPPSLGPKDAPARISHGLMIAGSDHAAEPIERIMDL